jgi:hypothetical protein
MSEDYKVRMDDPEAKLAMVYIDEYLRGKGQTLESICNLPKDQAKQLMIEASTYAAIKLADVDTKSRMIKDIHGGIGSGQLHTSQSD